MDLLQELNSEGQTIVMVTHNAENRSWFHRTVVLRDGRIEEDTTESSTAPLKRACA
jgi:putative ABC transport system ATP-binding protein